MALARPEVYEAMVTRSLRESTISELRDLIHEELKSLAIKHRKREHDYGTSPVRWRLFGGFLEAAGGPDSKGIASIAAGVRLESLRDCPEFQQSIFPSFHGDSTAKLTPTFDPTFSARTRKR